jgi:tetratricopeptide (TPR) repeat protein
MRGIRPPGDDMTHHKDHKRAIRARMRATGEKYTQARRAVLARTAACDAGDLDGPDRETLERTFARARSLMAEGRYEEAEAAVRSMIATGDPAAVAVAELTLATLLNEQGRFQEAEAAYRSVIATGDPDAVPSAELDLGELLHQKGHLEEAEAAYRSVIGSTNHEVAYKGAMALGSLLEQQDRDEEARAAFLLADQLSPDREEPLDKSRGRNEQR